MVLGPERPKIARLNYQGVVAEEEVFLPNRNLLDISPECGVHRLIVIISLSITSRWLTKHTPSISAHLSLHHATRLLQGRAMPIDRSYSRNTSQLRCSAELRITEV